MPSVINAEHEDPKSIAKLPVLASPASKVITAHEEAKVTLDVRSWPKKRVDDNLPTHTIASFVYLVDMSGHNCCGYSYVLRLVDPIARLGHITILKSISDDSLCTGFSKLMGIARFPPTTIYYDAKFTFLPSAASLYPHVVFTRQPHSDEMVKEHKLFIKQLKKWIFSYGTNWLRGVTIVQAVTNMLELE